MVTGSLMSWSLLQYFMASKLSSDIYSCHSCHNLAWNTTFWLVWDGQFLGMYNLMVTLYIVFVPMTWKQHIFWFIFLSRDTIVAHLRWTVFKYQFVHCTMYILNCTSYIVLWHYKTYLCIYFGIYFCLGTQLLLDCMRWAAVFKHHYLYFTITFDLYQWHVNNIYFDLYFCLGTQLWLIWDGQFSSTSMYIVHSTMYISDCTLNIVIFICTYMTYKQHM